MDRSNPYEAAFEAYLNAHGLCYIGVDEKKRSFLDETPVKNLDFVVLAAARGSFAGRCQRAPLSGRPSP